jgi:sugar/nucleoside kinase (ribokinase family)
LIERGTPVPAYGLLRPLLGELDVFFTSVDEARMIRNTLDHGHGAQVADDRVSSLSFLEYVTARFSGKGRRRTQLFGVTVKNGAFATLVGPDDRVHETVFCPSRFMAGSVIDLVGAGDSFRAGLIATIARHRGAFLDGTLNVEEAVQAGNLMASLYIKSPLTDRYGSIASLDALLAVVRSKREFASFEELTATLNALS